MSEKVARSEELFRRAVELMPGGVNSPVRAFHAVGLTPRFIARGEGAYLVDVDGNRYIDYVLSWGPLIAGHASWRVVRAVREVLEKGTSFGAPTEEEVLLAEEVVRRVPSVEMVRMVNSGTEATMSAVRLVRAVTGRRRIVKFVGCYHGHADPFLVQAGSGVATLSLPDSPGVPGETAGLTLTASFNDLAAVEELFHRFGEEIAAVIIEPVAGNMGVVPPEPGFLEGLRRLTREFGALLIFDEVMTGFRVHYASAQGLYGVDPDLTTMGKVIGGGLPVGAYGGRREFLELVAPAGPVYQAGTLSGNPLAMAAGRATLELLDMEAYAYLDRLAARLADVYRQVFARHGVPVCVQRVGSMFTPFFTECPVRNFEDARRQDLVLFRHLFREMLTEGIYLPASAFEAHFLSLAHTEEDIERTREALERALPRALAERKREAGGK